MGGKGKKGKGGGKPKGKKIDERKASEGVVRVKQDRNRRKKKCRKQAKEEEKQSRTEIPQLDNERQQRGKASKQSAPKDALETVAKAGSQAVREAALREITVSIASGHAATAKASDTNRVNGSQTILGDTIFEEPEVLGGVNADTEPQASTASYPAKPPPASPHPKRHTNSVTHPEKPLPLPLRNRKWPSLYPQVLPENSVPQEGSRGKRSKTSTLPEQRGSAVIQGGAAGSSTQIDGNLRKRSRERFSWEASRGDGTHDLHEAQTFIVDRGRTPETWATTTGNDGQQDGTCGCKPGCVIL